MTNRITITLKDYLDGGYELPTEFDQFYNITIFDTMYYNIRDMFITRNLYKEIGSETQELFKHNLGVLVNSAVSKYNFKLKLFEENVSNLMKRTVEESISLTERHTGSDTDSETNSGTDTSSTSKTGTDTSSSSNTDLLNPTNSESTKPVSKNEMEDSVTYDTEIEAKTFYGKETEKTKTYNNTKSKEETRNKGFGFFKSNPQIMENVLKLESVVEEVLIYLDRAFIGEY